MHPRHLGMAGQIFGDETGVVVRPRHADLEGFERAHQHPTRVRIELRADGTRQPITCFTRLTSPLILPPTRSLWPPTYLVREHSEMSAPHFSGVWNIGPSIVLSTTTGGLYPCALDSSSAIAAHAARSTRPLVGLAGRLDQDQTYPASRARCLRRLSHLGGIDAVSKAEKRSRRRRPSASEAAFRCRQREADCALWYRPPEKGE